MSAHDCTTCQECGYCDTSEPHEQQCIPGAQLYAEELHKAMFKEPVDE